MTAPVLAISNNTDTQKDRRRRELELSGAVSSADEAVHSHLRALGVLTRAPAFGAPATTELEQLLGDLWRARGKHQAFLEGRIRQLERTLRATFASDALDDAQRTAILETLYGRGAGNRDSAILSDAERSVIDRYRSMDLSGKQMIRTLFARLATTSPADDVKGGA